jgi:hypothetical protein
MLMTRVIPALHERHAPTTLQDAFYEALEAYDGWTPGQGEPSVMPEGKDVPISSIFGRMRTSDDVMPEMARLVLRAATALADQLATAEPTYAPVASHMRELVLERLRSEAGETSPKRRDRSSILCLQHRKNWNRQILLN